MMHEPWELLPSGFTAEYFAIRLGEGGGWEERKGHARTTPEPDRRGAAARDRRGARYLESSCNRR